MNDHLGPEWAGSFISLALKVSLSRLNSSDAVVHSGRHRGESVVADTDHRCQSVPDGLGHCAVVGDVEIPHAALATVATFGPRAQELRPPTPTLAPRYS